jgi:putative peptide zinc metalloprotease protein
MWIALGLVKVIHEFGHGLSCKAFGGEVHEMGALFLCLSPCLYANVSDAWTLPNKWHRIVISAAGIYVEFMIACIAAIVWWNTPTSPVINGIALNVMVVCSISTFFFNANPLMRYDGYYVLADWLEIPNLRDRSNRYLKNVVLEHCLGVEVQPEPYMALARRIGFVAYAIVSWIYRWVITFSILVFMGTFLKPYNLQIISQILALAAAGSMLGWPLYNLGKSLHRRGRLPDMKQTRVTVSAIVVGAVVLFFLFVPLPVSRVRETGVVQVQPNALAKVYLHVPNPCILEQMYIRDGEFVEQDQELAIFSSRELDSQLLQAETDYTISVEQLRALDRQYAGTFDPAEKEKIKKTIADTAGQRDTAYEQMEFFRKTKEFLVLRAPRAGVVMSPPKVDEIGKLWEKDQSMPFCSVGDVTQLRVLVPVGPADYRLLDEDLRSLRLRRGDEAELEAQIRVQGRAGNIWAGSVTQLPESEAREIPPPLSNKAGGPVAVRPSTNNDKFIPLSQQYLVSVEFKDPDRALAPGTMAQVKIHCRYRTCVWWVWRKLSSTFDLGLL